MLEWRFPTVLERFATRPNNSGHGVLRRLRFAESMTAAILSSHRRVPPFGLAGAKTGAVGHNWIQRQDGSREELESTATVEMAVGDACIIETPGGGGFGSP